MILGLANSFHTAESEFIILKLFFLLRERRRSREVLCTAQAVVQRILME
jgi:hypothetical protein